jgi:micrococcal nuclease
MEPTTARVLARRRRLRLLLATGLGLLLGLVILDHSGLLHRWGLLRPVGLRGYAGDDHAAFEGRTYVIRHVFDGDTVEIIPPAGGPATRVRLLGIDAPELNSRWGDPPQPWAHEALQYLRQTAQGHPVIVRLDPPRTRDRYDRLLAYLYLSEEVNLNLQLVRQGHALADRRFAHSLQAAFQQAQFAARKQKRGMWQAGVRQ